MISKDFSVDHIDIINLKLSYPCLFSLKETVFTDYENGDEGRTYIKDDRIIFCCGIRNDKNGVGSCWVIPSIYIDKYKIFFLKELKKLIEEYSKKMNLHRLYTVVLEEFKDYIEFLEFEKEGKMKKFTSDKKDMLMYARYF